MKRCEWSGTDAGMIAYHDEVWGVPIVGDREHFEFLTLEGAQAGLSWATILKRREGYRRAFADFDIEKVARFTPKRIEKTLQDTGIIRNRLKVESVVANARAILEMRNRGESLSDLLWGLVDGRPIQNKWKAMGEVPAETEESKRMSKELKARGFRFVGPTICYAHMQATGLVNDHTVDCFRHKEVKRMGKEIGKRAA